MAIKARPKPVDEKQIRALIHKGGGVKEVGDPTVLVQLRLKKSLVLRIDDERDSRTVPPSRHAWILEAILEHFGQ
jgi:hypothetical protein